ncbi:MAG: hypothetical protein AVDCRST_MAG08-737, partial [uncultured Acetobacteraceae bacterium]
MEEIARALPLALGLVASGDRELLGIVGLSLRVRMTAALVALAVGVPAA